MHKNKKILLSLILFFIISLIFTCSFANNEIKDMSNGVKNAVQGATNVVENTAKDISNTSKNITQDMQNGANNITNSVKDTMNNTDNNNNGNPVTSTTDGNYNATRTATTKNDNTFMGMSSNLWTWIIVGASVIAIAALVWYYTTKVNDSHYNDNF